MSLEGVTEQNVCYAVAIELFYKNFHVLIVPTFVDSP